MLQANMEKIDPSITIEVQSWTGSIYRGLVSGPTPGPVGLWFFGWAPDYADPDDYIQPFAKTNGAWTKSTGYSNTTIDAMIDRAQRIPNGPERLQLYHDIQVSLANDNVLLELYEATNYNAHKSYIGGWYYNPMKAGTDFSTLVKG
jgi:peptide/nickel transport system substrate-binding protein